MKKGIGVLAAVCLLGCAHVPSGPGARADLVNDARRTVNSFAQRSETFRRELDRSVAYVVFPRVGDGGFLVGGGAGAGVLFENGQPTGFADISHISVGGYAGGQRYGQVVVVRDQDTLRRLKSGSFDFGTNASAVILDSGAGVQAELRHGVRSFIDVHGGLLVSASLTGERITLRL